MNVNVAGFQEILKKSTVNFVIPSVQIKVDNERIKSKMRSQTNDVVVILDVPNDDIFTDVPDTLELNFDNPSTNVRPYLNLIDNEVVELAVTDEKLTLKDGRHKTNLFFCMASFVTAFTGNAPVVPNFHQLQLSENIRNCFDKVIKVGGTFEKVYFSVKNKRFIIEATDHSNRFSNGISFDLGACDYQDVDICFGFKNFNALFKVIYDTFDQFNATFTYLPEQESGMVLFEKRDGSEKYYLLSRQESA